jgi:AcrR family transcriptional regulator
MRGNEPQQDRSRATRERLLEAALESLAEVGWHGTTVVGVAARAGVSRGAAQHHFATRDDLVRATMDRVFDDFVEDLRKRAIEHSGDDRMLAGIESLADAWTETAGRASMQVWTAAATDPALRALALPFERRMSKDLFDIAAELLGADVEQPHVRDQIRLTLHMLRGRGLGMLARPELQRHRAELAQWAAVLAAMPGFGGFGG